LSCPPPRFPRRTARAQRVMVGMRLEQASHCSSQFAIENRRKFDSKYKREIRNVSLHLIGFVVHGALLRAGLDPLPPLRPRVTRAPCIASRTVSRCSRAPVIGLCTPPRILRTPSHPVCKWSFRHYIAPNASMHVLVPIRNHFLNGALVTRWH
jgi:hypothetical protein